MKHSLDNWQPVWLVSFLMRLPTWLLQVLQSLVLVTACVQGWRHQLKEASRLPCKMPSNLTKSRRQNV